MVPLRTRLHKPPGTIGGHQPGYPAVRSHMAVRGMSSLARRLAKAIWVDAASQFRSN